MEYFLIFSLKSFEGIARYLLDEKETDDTVKVHINTIQNLSHFGQATRSWRSTSKKEAEQEGDGGLRRSRTSILMRTSRQTVVRKVM
jgi:hypothetical protein